MNKFAYRRPKKIGSSVRVERKDPHGKDEVLIEDNENEYKEELKTDDENTRTVGCSVSIGNNLKFGATKMEVSVWVSSQCSKEESSSASQECQVEALRLVGELYNRTVETYELPFDVKTPKEINY